MSVRTSKRAGTLFVERQERWMISISSSHVQTFSDVQALRSFALVISAGNCQTPSRPHKVRYSKRTCMCT